MAGFLVNRVQSAGRDHQFDLHGPRHEVPGTGIDWESVSLLRMGITHSYTRGYPVSLAMTNELIQKLCISW